MDQELKDYLERQFAETNRQFDETNRQFDEIREGIQGNRDLVRNLDDKLSGEIAGLREEVHQTRILFEKLEDKVDLVAEGVQSNTEAMHRLAEEPKRDLKEHKIVIEAAHRHLEQRVSKHDTEIKTLRRRVDALGRMKPR